MPDLAIIIPFAGEFPHLPWTLQSVMDAFGLQIDYEVLAVDNYCEDARRHGVKINPIPECNSAGICQKLIDDGEAPWLRLLKYDAKLSHWGAKNHAVRNTKAPYLMFMDAHCALPAFGLPAIIQSMMDEDARDYSVHFSIANFVRNDPRFYRMVYNEKVGLLHYENQPATHDYPWNKSRYVFPVPCASTCGMICHRSLIEDVLEFWPEELGPYGGGENLFNFVMALTGKEVRMNMNIKPIRHFATGRHWARDYTITNDEWFRNRVIATFLIAGEEWLFKLIEHSKSMFCFSDRVCMQTEILGSDNLQARRERIKEKSIRSIEDFIDQWRGTGFSVFKEDGGI
jgi:hypothetical protein